jgi:putative ABC transport system permease protein
VRASVRWIRADLRARRGQAVIVTGVVAGVVTALLLSAALLQGATNPWQGLFAATRGAQIWLHLAPGTDVSDLRDRVPGITAVAGPYQAAAATLTAGGQRSRVELRAMAQEPPDVGVPLLVAGHWLRRADQGGVVLEESFAQAVHAQVGSVLEVHNVDGTSSTRVTVAGLAQTADQGFYPDQTPGLIWVLPRLLHVVDPASGHLEEVVGIRTANPADTGFVVQQIVTQLGSSAVGNVQTWQQVEQSMARRDPLLGLLLALFGLVALGAAALAIINVSTGRVLVQRAELGMLKTLGFTPRQVMVTLTVEHALLGTAGVAVGLAAAPLLTPVLLGNVPDVAAASVTVPVGWAVVIAAAALGMVVLATAVPAWSASRIWPVAAVRPAPVHGHLSTLATAAMAARLPPAIVLGARAAFVRRMPAALTIVGLVVPMLMITIGFGFWSTLDDVQRNPADIGLAAGLTASPAGMSYAQASRVIAADPQVKAAYPCVRATALTPAETTTITTLGMGTSQRPFPFHVVQGQIYRAPGEAVATQGLLDTLGARVGQYVRMWFGGVPVTFRIVGRIIDPQYGGQLLAYGRDTLTAEGAPAPLAFFSLILRPGVSQPAAASRLLRASHGRLAVEQVANPADQLGVVRVVLAGLIGVLALTALINVLTASLVGLRDHLRDVRVLRAMGLTPGQVGVALVARTSVLALVAVALGVTGGLAVSSALINATARVYGLGAGLARPPAVSTLVIGIVVAVAIAALAAAVPARAASRVPASAVLGP